MQRPTCRNGGQAFRMWISEGHTFAGKSVEIGGLNPPVAVSTEIVAAQSIRDNDNDIPGGCLSIATLLRGTIVDDDWLTHCTFLKFATYIYQALLEPVGANLKVGNKRVPKKIEIMARFR